MNNYFTILYLQNIKVIILFGMRLWILCWFLYARTVIYVPTKAYSTLRSGGHSVGDSRIEITESAQPGLHVTYVCPNGPFMNTYIKVKATVAAEMAYYYLWGLASAGKIDPGEFFETKGINVDFFPNNPNAVFGSWAVCMGMLELITGKKIKGKFAFMGEVWTNRIMTYAPEMDEDLIKYALDKYDKVFVGSSSSKNPKVTNVLKLYELKDIFDENPFKSKSTSIKSINITGSSPVMEEGDLHDIQVWAVPGTGQIKLIGHRDPKLAENVKISLELLLNPDEIDKMKAKDIVARFPAPIFGPSFGLTICIGIVAFFRDKRVKRYAFTGLCPNVCWNLAPNIVNKGRAARKLGTFVIMDTDYQEHKHQIDKLGLEIIQWPFFYSETWLDPVSLQKEDEDPVRRAQYLDKVNQVLEKVLVDKHAKDENQKFYEAVEAHDPMSIYKHFSAKPSAKAVYWIYTLVFFPITWLINHITYCIGTVFRLVGFRYWRNIINFSAEQISFLLLKLTCFLLKVSLFIVWFPLKEIIFYALNLFLNIAVFPVIWLVCIFASPFMIYSYEFVNYCIRGIRNFVYRSYMRSKTVDSYLMKPVELQLIDLITGIKYADRGIGMHFSFD